MFTQKDNEIFDQIVAKRSTCRSFSDRVPEAKDLEQIIKAGQFSPYASIDARAIEPCRDSGAGFFLLQQGFFKPEL